MQPSISSTRLALLRFLETALAGANGREPFGIQVVYGDRTFGPLVPFPPGLLADRDLPALLPGEDDDRTVDPGPGATPPPTRLKAPNLPRHSEDFSYLHWDGHDWHFKTDIQQAVLRQLVTAYEDGEPDVHQIVLLARARSDCKRLRDVFKHHPAWGVLIVPGPAPGTFRLAVPS